MKISIVVPVYNEEEFVATLLERVIAAPLPAGFDGEIIVADDGWKWSPSRRNTPG
jgi:glycosyltransferase involved in cell wall biosynthesis